MIFAGVGSVSICVPIRFERTAPNTQRLGDEVNEIGAVESLAM